VALAAILLQNADLILLDEPTNNLDLSAILWLRTSILEKCKNVTLIIVSHEIHFLDSVANKLFELNAAKGCLNISGGTYSDYIEMRQKAHMKYELEYESRQSELSRLQKQSQKRKDQSERGSQVGLAKACSVWPSIYL
ncbi:hypothetical protein SARC_12304, partial [Sphaeroforma arctica JP610]